MLLAYSVRVGVKMSFSRRDFLSTLSWSALFLGAGLPGCGSASNSALFPGQGGGQSVGDKAVSGVVDLSQIGGSGLQVQSAFLPGSPVVDGGFATRTSQQGAQVLFVTDGQSKVRALTVSLPDDASLRFDAASSALGLMFLTLGILTVDPQEARQRLTTLRSLVPWNALITFLIANLPTRSIQDLFQDASFLNLRQALVDAFQAQAAVTPKAGAGTGFIEATFDKDKSRVDLSNYGWRFVSLIRQELDIPPHETGHAVCNLEGTSNPLDGAPDNRPRNLISGVNPISWGNLFSAQVNTPGSAHETVVIPSSVTHLNYWSEGIGLGSLSLPLPATIAAQEFEYSGADFCTVFFYCFFPLLDILGAGGALLKEYQVVADLGLAALSTYGNLLGLVAAVHSGDNANYSASLSDLLTAMVATGALVTTYVASPAVAAVFGLLSTVAGLAGTVFSAANIAAFVNSVSQSPNISTVNLTLRAPQYLKVVLEHEDYDQGCVNSQGDVLYRTLYEAPTNPLDPPSIHSVIWLRYNSGTDFAELDSFSELAFLPGRGLSNDRNFCYLTGSPHAYQGDTTGTVEIPAAPGQGAPRPTWINDFGAIVGIDPGGDFWLRKDGQTIALDYRTTLGAGGQLIGFPFINNLGQVLGVLQQGDLFRAFVIDTRVDQPPEVLFETTEVIYPFGWTTGGKVYFNNDLGIRIWQGGTFETLAGPEYFGVSVNNNDQVLCYGPNATLNLSGDPVLLSGGQTLIVRDLVDAPFTEVIGLVPIQIADSGHILLSGANADNRGVGYLLNPR